MSLLQKQENTWDGDTLNVKGVTMAAKPFRHCIFILDELLSCYDCFQFLAPVPLTAVVYHKEIKKPMDFKTLENNLYQNKYKEYDDFVQDLCLIWDNAKLFHRSFDLIYQQAENLYKRYSSLDEFIKGGPKPFYLSSSTSDIDLILDSPLPEEKIILPPTQQPTVIFPMYKELDPPNKSNLYFVQALSEQDCNTKKLRGFSNVRLLFQHLNASFFEYMTQPTKYDTVPLPRFYIAKNRTLLNEAGTDSNGVLAVLCNVQIKPLTRDLYRLQATVIISEPMGETHGFDESSMDKSDEYEFCPKAWLKLRVLKVVENVNTVINADMDRSFFKKVYNTYKLSTKIPGDLKKVGNNDIAKEFAQSIINPVSSSAPQEEIVVKKHKKDVIIPPPVVTRPVKVPTAKPSSNPVKMPTRVVRSAVNPIPVPHSPVIMDAKNSQRSKSSSPATVRDIKKSVLAQLKGKAKSSSPLPKVKEEAKSTPSSPLHIKETVPVIQIRSSPVPSSKFKDVRPPKDTSPPRNMIRISPPAAVAEEKATKPTTIRLVLNKIQPKVIVHEDSSPEENDEAEKEDVMDVDKDVAKDELNTQAKDDKKQDSEEEEDNEDGQEDDKKKGDKNGKEDEDSDDGQGCDHMWYSDEDDESYVDAVDSHLSNTTTSPAAEDPETPTTTKEGEEENAEAQLTKTSVSFERYMEEDNKKETSSKGSDAAVKQYYIDASKELWQKLRDYSKEKKVPVVDINTYVDKTSSFPNAEGFFKHVYFLREDNQKVVQTFRRMTITQRTTEIASLLALKGLPHMGQITEVLQESHGEIIGLSMQRYQKTLKQYTHAHSHHRLTAHQKMDLIIQMLQCIEAIHKVGLAHRDLSEVNFMVNETDEKLRDGSPRAELFLIDFGKSTFTNPEDVRRWWIEHPTDLNDEYDGEIVPLTKEDLDIWCQQLPWIRSKPDHGYRLYRSVQTLPKNRTDTEDLPWLVNPLSEDIYSIGTIIWKTFSETEPWYGILDTDLKGLRETVGEDYHIERALQREVPGKLSKELLLKFLKVSPDQRQTATQVLNWLKDIQIQDGLIAEWEEHAPVGRQKRHAKALFRYDDEQAASTDLAPARKKQKSNNTTTNTSTNNTTNNGKSSQPPSPLQLHIPIRPLSPTNNQPPPRKLAPRPEYSSNSGRNHLGRNKRQENFNYYKST